MPDSLIVQAKRLTYPTPKTCESLNKKGSGLCRNRVTRPSGCYMHTDQTAINQGRHIGLLKWKSRQLNLKFDDKELFSFVQDRWGTLSPSQITLEWFKYWDTVRLSSIQPSSELLFLPSPAESVLDSESAVSSVSLPSSDIPSLTSTTSHSAHVGLPARSEPGKEPMEVSSDPASSFSKSMWHYAWSFLPSFSSGRECIREQSPIDVSFARSFNSSSSVNPPSFEDMRDSLRQIHASIPHMRSSRTRPSTSPTQLIALEAKVTAIQDQLTNLQRRLNTLSLDAREQQCVTGDIIGIQSVIARQLVTRPMDVDTR